MADPTLNDVADHLNNLSDGDLLDAIELVALEFSLLAEDRVKKGMNTRKLKPRTGRLRASVRGTARRSRSTVAVTIQAGSKNLPYIFTHEFGAVIRPRRSKWLRIPLRAAKTGVGVDRFSTPLRAAAPDKFYAARSKKGNLLLFDRKTHKPWYVLKKRTVVPKAPTVGPAFVWLQKNMIPELEDAIAFALRDD